MGADPRPLPREVQRAAEAKARADRAEAKAEVRRRRAEAGWYEWALSELAVYLYALGVLAVLVFVPLQMEASWLPIGAPPVLEPSIVVAAALAFIATFAYLGFLGHRYLWGEGGPVARAIARHEGPGGPEGRRKAL